MRERRGQKLPGSSTVPVLRDLSLCCFCTKFSSPFDDESITIITSRCGHKPLSKLPRKKKKKKKEIIAPYLRVLNLPTQLCCLQLWLRLCAQACPGLQVSRHKIKPCQPAAASSAKPASCLLSEGCFPPARLLVVWAGEQMPVPLVAAVIARKESVTEEAEAEAPASPQPCLSDGVRVAALQPLARSGLRSELFSLIGLCQGRGSGSRSKSVLSSLLRTTRGRG